MKGEDVATDACSYSSIATSNIIAIRNTSQTCFKNRTYGSKTLNTDRLVRTMGIVSFCLHRGLLSPLRLTMSLRPTASVPRIESPQIQTVMRVLGRWMRMITIPNQSSVAKAYQEFDVDGRMKPSSYYERVVDVLEELMKFTYLTRDVSGYLTNRYSERKEANGG
eukprot:gene6517-8812_t